MWAFGVVNHSYISIGKAVAQIGPSFTCTYPASHAISSCLHDFARGGPLAAGVGSRSTGVTSRILLRFTQAAGAAAAGAGAALCCSVTSPSAASPPCFLLLVNAAHA